MILAGVLPQWFNAGVKEMLKAPYNRALRDLTLLPASTIIPNESRIIEKPLEIGWEFFVSTGFMLLEE